MVNVAVAVALVVIEVLLVKNYQDEKKKAA